MLLYLVENRDRRRVSQGGALPVGLERELRLRQRADPGDCAVAQELGDNARAPQFIETLPTMGYRFVAPVEVLREMQAAPAAQRRLGSRLPWILAVAGSLLPC